MTDQTGTTLSASYSVRGPPGTCELSTKPRIGHCLSNWQNETTFHVTRASAFRKQDLENKANKETEDMLAAALGSVC